MKREEIKKQAKKIMDNFAAALERAGIKEEEARVERAEDRRSEGDGGEDDSEFRKIMLKNAPETKDECIQGEKGEWVE